MTAARLKAAGRTVLPEPVHRLYREQRHRWWIGHFPRRTITEQFGDSQFTISIEDSLGEGWYGQGMPEPQEITALRPWLNSGELVLDLGAHQAVVALMLAAIVGPNGRVVALEAYGHNARVARRNCELNNADNVEVVHAAVAARSGVAWFTEGFNGHVEESSSRIGKALVPAMTVDELTERYGAPAAVLIDVEGQELRALQGAELTLATRAAFLVEVHPDKLAALGQTPADVIAILGDRSILGANMGQPFEPLRGEHRRFLLATRP